MKMLLKSMRTYVKTVKGDIYDNKINGTIPWWTKNHCFPNGACLWTL